MAPLTWLISIIYTYGFYRLVVAQDDWIDTLVIDLTTEKEKSKMWGFLVAGFFLIAETIAYLLYMCNDNFAQISILENFVRFWISIHVSYSNRLFSCIVTTRIRKRTY